MRTRVNIAGAFAKKNELKMFIFKNKHILNNLDVTVYDGINNCSWNGGRINRDIGTKLGTLVTPAGLKEYFPIKQGEDNSDQEFVKDFVSSLGKANKGTDNIFGSMNLNIKDDTTPFTEL